MWAFVSLGGIKLLSASAHARVVNFATNLGALLLFALLGKVEFKLALPGSAAAFAGGVAGASWAVKRGSSGIRPFFTTAAVLMLLKVVWDTFFSGG